MHGHRAHHNKVGTMNRTDRLLAIVLELQAKGWQRAVDLAHTFGISRRTVYRDLQALDQSGVPIVAIAGRGYSLVEGYFLPPLRFSVDEATMLLLGSKAMTQIFDAQYRAAAESAARKITAILSAEIRDAVDAVQSSLQLIPVHQMSHERLTQLQRLRGAVLDCRQIRFRYHARFRPADDPLSEEMRESPTATERTSDPYSITLVSGSWYLTAFDHLRQAIRRFKLDRIEDLTVLDTTFTRPSDPHLVARQNDPTMALTVRLQVDSQIARWVRESPSFFTVAEEVVEDGLIVTLRVRHIDEITQWVLGWGQHVRVLEPESLRQRIMEECRQILAQSPTLLP